MDAGDSPPVDTPRRPRGRRPPGSARLPSREGAPHGRAPPVPGALPLGPWRTAPPRPAATPRTPAADRARGPRDRARRRPRPTRRRPPRGPCSRAPRRSWTRRGSRAASTRCSGRGDRGGAATAAGDRPRQLPQLRADVRPAAGIPRCHARSVRSAEGDERQDAELLTACRARDAERRRCRSRSRPALRPRRIAPITPETSAAVVGSSSTPSLSMSLFRKPIIATPATTHSDSSGLKYVASSSSSAGRSSLGTRQRARHGDRRALLPGERRAAGESTCATFSVEAPPEREGAGVGRAIRAVGGAARGVHAEPHDVHRGAAEAEEREREVEEARDQDVAGAERGQPISRYSSRLGTTP